MKARIFKKRKIPVDFPVLARWEAPETIFHGSLLLFVNNTDGFVIKSHPKQNHPKNHFQTGCLPINYKDDLYKDHWEILGTPEKFGLQIINNKVVGEFKEV